MNAQEYIQHQLNLLKSAEQPAIHLASNQELADFIFKATFNKKFRKFSTDPDFQARSRTAIQKSIKDNEPIKFVFPFGGYKLWRLDENPEADWAELFTVMYYAKWLLPIAQIYKPGVWFDFSSDDIIVERMNNISKNDTEAYAKSFLQIINFLKKYIPNNLRFTFTPISFLYTPEEFEADLQTQIEAKHAEYGGLPTLDDKHKRMVEMNVKLKPGQNDDPLWREKIELLHQAYYAVSKRRPYTRATDKILVFVTKGKDYLAVGTTKTSVAKFWVGIGALKKECDSYIEYVLSPSQLDKANFVWEDISISGLKGKNFSHVRVID
jgi:hypothetical protein